MFQMWPVTVEIGHFMMGSNCQVQTTHRWKWITKANDRNLAPKIIMLIPPFQHWSADLWCTATYFQDSKKTRLQSMIRNCIFWSNNQGIYICKLISTYVEFLIIWSNVRNVWMCSKCCHRLWAQCCRYLRWYLIFVWHDTLDLYLFAQSQYRFLISKAQMLHDEGQS